MQIHPDSTHLGLQQQLDSHPYMHTLCLLYFSWVADLFYIPEYKKKLAGASDEGRDDAEYEEIPAAATGAVAAATNITMTQNSAYSLPCE